nr:putative reverse transcriptase domain-containing protein [Tanacetum cinerariifolium]
NSCVKTTTPEEAYAMTWATLKKKMTIKYCLRGEIKKIETEMWNLKGSSKGVCGWKYGGKPRQRRCGYVPLK